jgi:hypothetical protein
MPGHASPPAGQKARMRCKDEKKEGRTRRGSTGQNQPTNVPCESCYGIPELLGPGSWGQPSAAHLVLAGDDQPPLALQALVPPCSRRAGRQAGGQAAEAHFSARGPFM